MKLFPFHTNSTADMFCYLNCDLVCQCRQGIIWLHPNIPKQYYRPSTDTVTSLYLILIKALSLFMPLQMIIHKSNKQTN